MELEDLKRLRRHVDIAIDIAERGGLIQMTEREKQDFKDRFGDCDMVIGNFIIKMCSAEQQE